VVLPYVERKSVDWIDVATEKCQVSCRKVHCLVGMGGLHSRFNSLNAELNPICCLLALLGAHYIIHVNRIGVKEII
jgi:hypothetical protein